MDVRMPDMAGIDALLAIRTESADARVIMLTTFEGDVEIQRAPEAGARGYMLKSRPRKRLADMIRKVHAGKQQIPPEIAVQLIEHTGDETLSKREVDVPQKFAGGNRNSDIAALLFISAETVKAPSNHIVEKIGASDRTEAAAVGIRRGIIHL
jgi:DNA-binding NarL/FixJ family response regulator